MKQELLKLTLMYLSDMYFDTADELIRSGDREEASFFTSIGAELRRFCELAFGELPQRDYMRGVYRTKHKDEKKLNALAMQLSEKVLQHAPQEEDMDEMRKAIHERVRPFLTNREFRPLAKLITEKIKTDDYIKITAADIATLVMEEVASHDF